jgi:hypothetical protein
MATTTNFGWETPDDTDLVKDGALAMRTLGNAIDASLVDLKGGTTGQVLSKTSNTDMDFTWITSDDANAIQNAIVDAKGDLITATAADTPARLAVGSNGDTLVADSAATTGLRWQGNYSAAKNKLINGDFTINQRAFSSVTASGYTFDRWNANIAGDGTATFTPQTFTAGAAPVAGYEATNFLQIATTGQTTTAVRSFAEQRIEDVRTFAGQTITVSFWAKAASGTPSIAADVIQNFGSGGSASVTVAGQKTAITTSWARYSFTFTVASISGKTIGTGSYFSVRLWTSAGSNFNTETNTLGIQTATIGIWGVQAEIGNVSTSFQTATGTLQGELAACQRYYWRFGGDTEYQRFGNGLFFSSTQCAITVQHPVPLRTNPTVLDYSTLAVYDGASIIALTNAAISATGKYCVNIQGTVASGGTTSRALQLMTNNSLSGYLGIGAEL